MITFNNQRVILNRLNEAYQSRSSQPCQQLTGEGICNGILNLYFRKAIKNMKAANSAFTYEIALKTRDQMKKVYQDIMDNNCDMQKKVDQLCFFQQPRHPQPDGSFCDQNLHLTNNDIENINFSYNSSKYFANKNKNPKPTGPDSLPYLKYYKGASVSQHFSGCLHKNKLATALNYYLPNHENQLIRIGTTLHVIGAGYHQVDGKHIVTILDPNYDISDPMRIIEADSLEQAVEALVASMGESFYDVYPGYFDSIANPNKHLSVSIKFYNFPPEIPQEKVSEKSGATLLMELLQQTDEEEIKASDNNGYDSLFISAQTGNSAAVQNLLTQYPNTMKPNAKQGEGKYRASPLAVSKQHGYEEVTNLLMMA